MGICGEYTGRSDMSDLQEPGTLIRIAGPVVVARGLEHTAMYDVVRVGELRLLGEVIRLDNSNATIQVYEDTSGLCAGEPVESTHAPLQVELGPGLLGTVYDGIQRPLPELAKSQGAFIQRGATLFGLERTRKWNFAPQVAVGQPVRAGDVLGTVNETPSLVHKILVPPTGGGEARAYIVETIRAGELTVDECAAEIRDAATGKIRRVCLMQRWAVRERRPFAHKLDPEVPLLTGQRVIDSLFPIARGGTAIIPGGFGTGKTVMEQTLAKWADADVVVYVGCGERGNEMTEVLEEFPKLTDPRTGAPLMERTVLIANTSNMPVAAREASIYTGITIAEYYRDMGYAVALLADSTSRWGEALREVSGRLEEMPGEEGYPAYLGTRLADFYERAGRVIVLGSDPVETFRQNVSSAREGSVTIIGAVSPPGADFSEPMTQNSLRVAGAFWALDYDLSRRRHFPAINWIRSYSLFDLRAWFRENVAPDWNEQVRRAQALLQREAELEEIAQLVGVEALPESEKALLQVARILREDFLQQYAYDVADAFCPVEKQYAMLRAILVLHNLLDEAVRRGVALEKALSVPEIGELARMKEWQMPAAREKIRDLTGRLEKALVNL
jgi:V/A-type H+-transporting ATPase subunit A